MTEEQKRVIEKITSVIPVMTEQEKARTLGFVEGLAFFAEMNGQTPTVRESEQSQ